MAIADFYKDTFSVYTSTWTQDSMGGRVQSRSARGTGVACRIEDKSDEEVAYLGLEKSQQAFTIFSTLSFDVFENDELDFTYRGTTYAKVRVVWADKLYRKSAYHHTEILAVTEVNKS